LASSCFFSLKQSENNINYPQIGSRMVGGIISVKSDKSGEKGWGKLKKKYTTRKRHPCVQKSLFLSRSRPKSTSNQTALLRLTISHYFWCASSVCHELTFNVAIIRVVVVRIRGQKEKEKETVLRVACDTKPVTVYIFAPFSSPLHPSGVPLHSHTLTFSPA
jgi:hypothetical protein